MRQFHLTNVGGLKTAVFPMLVEGSGTGREYSGEPVLKQCIDEMSDVDLDFFLAQFVRPFMK